MKLWHFLRFSVFVWTGDYDSNMLRVVACLLENGGKNLRNKKYPDITAGPIFVHLCLFHVFLFPLCLVFSFTLEKECFNNWIHYTDFVPPRLFPSLSLQLIWSGWKFKKEFKTSLKFIKKKQNKF